MQTDLVIHEVTHATIQQFLSHPTNTALLAGPDGIGKGTLATAIASDILGVPAEKISTHPHIMRISPEGTSISIEAIRELQKFLQLKTIGVKDIRRGVIIEHAQNLTTEAQNAFLKLLEEPPTDTLMLLTANSPRALLPTILSRVPVIMVHPPTEQQLSKLIENTPGDEASKKQAYFLSGGLPGLLKALLDSDTDHPLVASVAAAKDILQKQTFERLAMVDALSKQKEIAAAMLEALERIAQAGVIGAANRQDQARIKQWHVIRKQTRTAREALDHSANTKLTLSNLFLHLPG